MSKQVETNFSTGPIMWPLLKFAIPIFLALLLQTMYGAIDLAVIGYFGNASDVAAVNIGGWIMYAITAAISSLAVGTTVLLGRNLGAGEIAKCGSLMGASIALFAVLGLITTGVLVFFSRQFTLLMQTPSEAVQGTIDYIVYCALGTVFIVAFNVLGSIFRGIGNSVVPLIAVGIAFFFNIAGDLLLVGLWNMGPKGAAIATSVSQGLSVLISIWIISRMKLPFKFSYRDIRWDWSHIKAICKLGIPISTQDILVSGSFLAITAFVNSMGVVASAGVGVAERICSFIMLVPGAFAQAMSAFTAQNMGACKPKRARRALTYAIGVSTLIGIVMAYLAYCHGAFFNGLFSHEAPVIQAATEYLKAYAIDCLLVCFLFCLIGYFNGCGHTTFIMCMGIFGALCVRIPVSYWASRQVPADLFTIGLAIPATTIVQLLISFVFLAYTLKKKAHRYQHHVTPLHLTRALKT